MTYLASCPDNVVRRAHFPGTYRSFPDFLCARIKRALRPVCRTTVKMESTLVMRDQFNITPQGIVHKPTDAAFTPYPATHCRASRASVISATIIPVLGLALRLCSGSCPSFGPNMSLATRNFLKLRLPVRGGGRSDALSQLIARGTIARKQ